MATLLVFDALVSCCVKLSRRRRRVKSRPPCCWCYVKMSWGNCYVEVSCPHGDFHVEPEGVASSRTVEGGRRGPDHQPPGGDGAASQCPPGPATQEALPGWGALALRHGSRGRPSPRRLADAVREQIAHLMKTVYVGFNDTHLTEKLREQHHLPVCR